MTTIGKTLRLGRIFRNDGNSLIVAMDHAMSDGPIRGLEEPSETLDKVIRGGADAVMTSMGMISRFHQIMKGRVGTILRLDGGETFFCRRIHRQTEWSSLFRVEDAIRIGADGVIVMGFIGASNEADTLRNLAVAARECSQWGMPLLAEMLPFRSEKIRDPYSADAIAAASRIGAEFGADVIKTYYSGTPNSFRIVTKKCPAPVLVAGGERMKTSRDVLEVARGIMDGGGKGVIFGRNIWQHKDPEAMVRALRKIVHDDASVPDAMNALMD